MKKSKVLTILAALVCVASGLRGQSGPIMQSLKQISTVGDGILFGLNGQGVVFMWTGVNWVLIEGQQLAQISAGSPTEIWGVTANYDVYKITSAGWQRQPGPMRQVAVSRGGAAIVGINPSGKPYRWENNAWIYIPNAPALTQIAIGGPGAVYGITNSDTIWKWISNSNRWVQLKGKFRQISIAADGTVAAKDGNGVGYVRTAANVEAEVNGSTAPPEWNTMDMKVSYVEVLDNQNLMILDPAGQIAQQYTSTPPLAGAPVVLDSTLVVSNIYDPAPEYTVDIGSLSYPPEVCSPVNVNGQPGICLPTRIQQIQTPNSSRFTIVRAVPQAGPLAPGLRPDLVSTYFNFRLGEGTSTEYVATKVDPLTLTGGGSCEPQHFRVQSAHSWAEFRLPKGSTAQTVFIPPGAYNKYVFPACNRVWWDTLIYMCDAKLGWRQIVGKYGADGFCTGSTPQSPYLQVGDR